MTEENNDTFALPEETPQDPPYMEEIFPQVDPNQVEKELLEQFKEMQANMPPEDVAAHFFQMYMPIYRQLLNGLSNKDARRVAEHVVQWPLEEAQPHFQNKQAMMAFQCGQRLIDCKMIMKGAFEMERVKEAQIMKMKNEAEKQEAITGEPVEQTNVTVESVQQGEETNGKDV